MAISLPQAMTFAAPLNGVTVGAGAPVNVPLADGRIVAEADARVLLERVVFGVTDATGVTDAGVTDTGVTDTGVIDGTGVDSLMGEV